VELLVDLRIDGARHDLHVGEGVGDRVHTLRQRIGKRQMCGSGPAPGQVGSVADPGSGAFLTPGSGIR
jgi:hypothetical protein